MEAVSRLVFSTRRNIADSRNQYFLINPIVSLQIIFGRELYYLMLNKLGCLNTIWGTAMGIQTARKRKNSFRICKEIRYIIIPSVECIGIVYWSYITAKAKFTDKTMVKTVMLMGKLCFWIIGMMTLFLRKLLFQVTYTVERLKQYWEQYRNN